MSDFGHFMAFREPPTLTDFMAGAAVGTSAMPLNDLLRSRWNDMDPSELSTVASILWQMLLGAIDLDRSPKKRGEVMIVPHGSAEATRFDLLVLEEDGPGRAELHRMSEPWNPTHVVRGGPPGSSQRRRDTFHAEATSAWLKNRVDELEHEHSAHARAHAVRMLRLALRIIEDGLLLQFITECRPNIVSGRLPRIEVTALLVSPLSVATRGITAGASTAGVVVRDHNKGLDGVTAALHAVSALTGSIAVGVHSGTLHQSDMISDSCFIETTAHHGSTRSAPSYIKTAPGAFQAVNFDGVASGAQSGNVQAWSPDIPLLLKISQLKVFTNPITARGDSGAALVNGSGEIVGLSLYRTGTANPALPNYSAWVWAYSAFTALDVWPI